MKNTCQPFQKSLLIPIGTLASLFVINQVYANGFYAFDQSSASYGLAGAYQTNAYGVDATYYNPANLVFIKSPESEWAFDFTWGHQNPVEYNGTINIPAPGTPATNEQDALDAFVPYLFYVSEQYDGWRWGISTTYQGVTAAWPGQPQKFLVGESTAATAILNPVISYQVNDNWSLGGGLQATYSFIEQKSSGSLFGPPMSLDVEADGFELSYNLATTFKASEDITLSAVYRSSIETELSGDATAVDGIDNYDGGVELDILTPAVLRLGAAFDLDNDTTLEVVASRVFWSDYDTAGLNFDRTLAGPAELYQTTAVKNWRDTDTIHIGLSHDYNEHLKLLLGIARDLNAAVPEQNINFDWLDSKASYFGAGMRYQLKKDYEIGLSYQYVRYDDNSVSNAVIQGEYERNTHVLSASIESRF